MNILILGNIIALFAASLSVIMGLTKKREKIIYIQTIQFFTYTISNLILGGFSGVIANAIGAIRNILSYKEKLTKKVRLIIIIISIILTLSFNNLGFIGLLPLINTIIYTTFINEKNPFKFKILYMITVILWLLYDFSIKAYTSVLFEIITIMSCIITAYQIYLNKNKEKQQN